MPSANCEKIIRYEIKYSTVSLYSSLSSSKSTSYKNYWNFDSDGAANISISISAVNDKNLKSAQTSRNVISPPLGNYIF